MFGADASDNELLLMETIHLFVELLDQYFSNVCEVKKLSLLIATSYQIHTCDFIKH